MHFFQLRLLVPMHAPFIDMFISIQLFTRYKKTEQLYWFATFVKLKLYSRAQIKSIHYLMYPYSRRFDFHSFEIDPISSVNYFICKFPLRRIVLNKTHSINIRT